MAQAARWGRRSPRWRAAPPPRWDTNFHVIAVSRFNNSAARGWLEERGVATIACDLFKRDDVARLPDAGDVLYLVGVKFGTSHNPSLTWAANTIIPTNVAERFPHARMVALSTGNVYPLVSVADGGAVERHPLTPLGEYANAAVARERLFEFHSQRQGTPMVLVRLNYAVELRYGVLHDLARKPGPERRWTWRTATSIASGKATRTTLSCGCLLWLQARRST